MSRDYDYIKDLDIRKIGFKVLDSWIVTGSNENQHMELVKICCNFLYDLSKLLISVHFDLYLFFCFFLGFKVIEFIAPISKGIKVKWC